MEFVKDKCIAKATDWVAEFVPDVFCMFGCHNEDCRVHPLKNSKWYRFNNSKEEGGAEGKDGFWTCGVCMVRFNQAIANPKRLFCLPLAGNYESDSKEYMLAYWGKHTDSEDAKFAQ